MTEARLREIWKKTDGHCHFCGDAIDFKKRGYGTGRLDGFWEVDHVSQRARGGSASAENYLPACTRCNRLRWHRSGAELRELLLLGLIAKDEIGVMSDTGKELVRLRNRRLRSNALRIGLSLKRFDGDPVAKERLRQENRDVLIKQLGAHPDEFFRAAELSRMTGVPKFAVLPASDGSRSVDIVREGGRYQFRGRPRRRAKPSRQR